MTPPLKSTTGFWVSFGSTLLHPANLVAFGLAFNWIEDNGVPIDTMLDRLMLVAGVFAGAVAVMDLCDHGGSAVGGKVSLEKFQTRFKQGLAAVCLITGLLALASLS